MCNAISLTMGLGVIFPVLALVLDRRPVLTLYPSVIVPPVTKPGSMIQIEWETVAHRSCDGEAKEMIVDSAGRIFYYAPTPTVRKTIGVREHFVRELMVPRGSSPGQAHYVSYVERWCNELQRIVWPMREHYRTAFEIEKP